VSPPLGLSQDLLWSGIAELLLEKQRGLRQIEDDNLQYFPKLVRADAMRFQSLEDVSRV
jgi:hypothetical protein